MNAQKDNYTCAETAKFVRASLKESFPGIKFSVRSKTYSGGSSISVGWTDGPTTAVVNAVVDSFTGATFDGMTDCKNYHSQQFEGRTVSFGADYIFANRDFSEAVQLAAVEDVFKRFGLEGNTERPTVRRYKSGVVSLDWTNEQMIHGEWMGTWLHRELFNKDLLDATPVKI